MSEYVLELGKYMQFHICSALWRDNLMPRLLHVQLYVPGFDLTVYLVPMKFQRNNVCVYNYMYTITTIVAFQFSM